MGTMRTENHMSIQWGRVLLAAFLMEVVLIAIAVPLSWCGGGLRRISSRIFPEQQFLDVDTLRLS